MRKTMVLKRQLSTSTGLLTLLSHVVAEVLRRPVSELKGEERAAEFNAPRTV